MGAGVEVSCFFFFLTGGVNGIALGLRNALVIEFCTFVCWFGLVGEDFWTFVCFFDLFYLPILNIGWRCGRS